MNTVDYCYEDIAKMIDHALLNPASTKSDLEQGIQLAIEYDVASVCILPYFVKRCAALLQGTTVKTSTTIGFPHGANTTEVKVAEAHIAIADGCEELDMVVNVSQVLSGEWKSIEHEIGSIVDVAHNAGQKVKVIFENAYLSEGQKIKLCEICTKQNADWVKTSTGFATGGATIEDIELMRQNVGEVVQLKAAGGIRDLDTLLAYRKLGVTRCGASQTKAILDEARRRLELPQINAMANDVSGY